MSLISRWCIINCHSVRDQPNALSPMSTKSFRAVLSYVCVFDATVLKIVFKALVMLKHGITKFPTIPSTWRCRVQGTRFEPILFYLHLKKQPKKLNSVKNTRDRSSLIQWLHRDKWTLPGIINSSLRTGLIGKIIPNRTKPWNSTISPITRDLGPGPKNGDHDKNRREIPI